MDKATEGSRHDVDSDALDQSLALNKLVTHLLESEKKKHTFSLTAMAVIGIVFLISIMYIIHSAEATRQDLLSEMATMRQEFQQQLAEERSDFLDYLNGLEVTETTTTTTETTQSVEGEGASLINGNQYNDSATHNERKDGLAAEEGSDE